MASTSSVGRTPTPPTPAGLTSETEVLHRHLVELRRLQTAGRWVLSITTLIVILQFAVFSYAMYRKLSRNFSRDEIQRAVTERGDQVLPLAQQLLMQTGKNALPAYRDAMIAAIHARGPMLAKEAQDRFEKVPEETGKTAQEKLQTAFTDVLQRIEPDFKAAFPSLSDEKRQQLTQAFLADEIQKQNTQIADHITQLYTNDLIKVQGALESFDLPAADSKQASGDELEHNVLHSMVMLLDDQLDRAYGTNASDDTAMPAGMPGGMPSTRPTTMPGAQTSATK